MLGSVIAHEQIDVLYQPLIEPRTRPHRRRRGAGAIGRSCRRAKALFARAAAAGLDERLSRLVQRKALRCAAVWEGPLKGLGLSINLLPEDISRDGYEHWLLDEIAAAGIDPTRITVEITESALLVDQDGCRRAAGAAARAPESASPSTISAPAMPASLT